MQNRFPAVAGPQVLGGDKVQVGIGRVQTLGDQDGGNPGQFRLIVSVCGIHTCLGGALGLRGQRSSRSSPSIILSPPPLLAFCLISWEVDEQTSLVQACAEDMRAHQED